MFDFGEDDEKIVNIVKEFAKMRAEQAAKEKAGIYLKSYSKSVNGMINDDDISVVTNNTAEILDVKYKKIPIQAHDVEGNDTGKIGFLNEATVTVKIDTSEISKYIKMSPQERLNLINQNKNLKKSTEKINEDFENLRKQSGTLNNTQIIIEFYKIENKVLSQQKFYEGNKLYYEKDYRGAISKYNEAFKLNPDSEEIKYNREIAENSSKNYNLEKTSTKVPAEATEYKGHRYKLFNEGMTWQQAKKYCESIGGHLVTITSEGEQSFVYDLLMMNGEKNSYWLGGFKGSNGNWRWVTNEPFNYTKWGWNQPDGDGSALMIYFSTGNGWPMGVWNDLNSDGTCGDQTFFGIRNFGFICEWDFY